MKISRILSSAIILIVLFSTAPHIVFGAESKNEAYTDWQDEAIYSIFVDRFKNGNSENDYQIDITDPETFQGGDIEGIIEELDYIKDMGYTAIALSPIMDNQENGYHGFWITDFMAVEEHFGTMEDLKRLVQEAHKRDMKVVLGFVVNHTGTDHPWLDNQDKSDWFHQKREAGGSQEERELAWLEGLPDLNQSNPEVKQYLFDAAAYWINETDIDGYRLDRVEYVPKKFWTDFSTHVKNIDPDFFLLGEVNNTSPEVIADYQETGIDSFVDYHFLNLSADIFSEPGNSLEPLYELWQVNQENYDKPKLLGTLLDDENSKRFTRRVVENKQNPITRWKLALTYLFAAPGMPITYQGSEVPMDGGETPDNRKMTQINGGSDELQQYIEQMAALREEFSALSQGSFELLESDGAFQLFKRVYQDEVVYIAINNDTETKTLPLKDNLDKDTQLRGLLQDNIVRMAEGAFHITLDRETADVFIVEENQGLNWLFIAFVLGVMAIFIGAVIYLSVKNRKSVSSKENPALSNNKGLKH